MLPAAQQFKYSTAGDFGGDFGGGSGSDSGGLHSGSGSRAGVTACVALACCCSASVDAVEHTVLPIVSTRTRPARRRQSVRAHGRIKSEAVWPLESGPR